MHLFVHSRYPAHFSNARGILNQILRCQISNLSAVACIYTAFRCTTTGAGITERACIFFVLSPPPSPQSLLQFVHLQVASGNEQVVILLLVAAVRQSPRVYEVQKKRQYSVGQTRSLQFHQGTSRGQDRCQHRTGRCQDTPGGGKSCSIRDARSL